MQRETSFIGCCVLEQDGECGGGMWVKKVPLPVTSYHMRQASSTNRSHAHRCVCENADYSE